MLWPAVEPWPVCESEHFCPPTIYTVAGELRLRALLREIEAAGGQRTPAQEEELLRLPEETSATWLASEGPIPLLPILQLYLRDAHGVVRGPAGADLVQILWCPFDHEPECMPTTAIRWRRSDEIGEVLQDPPMPTLTQEGCYLPEPCILHPEPVTEYPPALLLPDEINRQLSAWMESGESRPAFGNEGRDMADYQYALSVAPGCKVGGWAPVSFRDVEQVDCSSCGAAMTPFFYIDSSEWDAGTYSWRPVEEFGDEAGPHKNPLANEEDEIGISIGRGYGMQVYTCPAGPDHPHVEIMQ